MLVLSRRNQEAVVISSNNGVERVIKVTVLGICGDRVKLGFEADADVPIHRAEVWERIAAEQSSPEPQSSDARQREAVPYLN